MIYLQLFYTFFKIGLFGFGGGYAMLSMIQGEVVTRYGWVSSQEFTDIVAISQMTPGPIGINAATYVGFTSTGSVWGSIIATFAVVLPSFILMLTISKFFLKYQKHPVVESVFSGLRPAVVGLLASAALVLMNVENFGECYHLPNSLCRNKKIQSKPHINDYCLRNCRTNTLLKERRWENGEGRSTMQRDNTAYFSPLHSPISLFRSPFIRVLLFCLPI